jgi:hypothetical protein
MEREANMGGGIVQVAKRKDEAIGAGGRMARQEHESKGTNE